MTTITKEEVKAFIEQIESDLSNGWEAQIFELKLARIALAALEVAPVGEVSEKRHGLVMDGTVDLGGKSTYRIIKGEKAMKRLPLGTNFYIVPPVPVDNEFIPKNLDRALGVVGVALPESKEEFNFQIERWIQRLIDRVIRYADEFKEQPAPVVPDEKRDDDGSVTSDFDHGWNACRAAMLQGSQPVSNCDELQVIGWLRSDYNSDDKRDPDAPLFMLGSNNPSETWGVKYMPLTGNSPVTPDGWISCSEQMPDEIGRYWCYVEEQNDLGKSHYQWNCSWNGDKWGSEMMSGKVTHWMPLPEPPQEFNRG
ncbi:TPA: DUF551 domain-containing protein [Salmonella enterica]|nr:DUF551 domain-containing protein [Salmonella enterica]